jgi:hypothetical protein
MADDSRIDVQIKATADELQAGFDQAKSTVSDATGQMKADLDKLGQGSSGATSQIADSFKEMHGQITSQISQITAAISGLGEAFIGIGALLGGGALFKGVVDSYVEMNLEAKKLSMQMGISVGEAGALIEAYKRVGVSSDTVSQALRMLERNIKTNGDAVVDMGRQVGVSIDLNSSLEKIYFGVTEALGKYEVGHQRNQAALAAFGARVQNINDLLRVHQADVAESSRRLQALGIELGDESVAQARKFQTGMADVNLVFDAVKYKIGVELIPTLIEFGKTFANLGPTIAGAANAIIKGIEFIVNSPAFQELLVGFHAIGAVGGWLGGMGGKGGGAGMPSAMGGAYGMHGGEWEGGAPYTPLDKSKGGGGAPGLLEQWKEELEQLKTEQNAFLDFSKEKEKEFWEAKLTQCAEGSKEYLAVSREIYTIDKALAQDAAKEKIAALNRQMTSEKTDWDARKALMAQEVAFVKTTYGEQSSEYRAVLQRQAQFDQEYDKQQRTLAQSRLDNELKLGQMRIAAAQEEVKFKENMGQISASTAAAQETALTQQSLTLEQRHIEQSKANWTGYYQEMQKLDQQEAEFKEKKLLEVQKANEQAAQKELQDIKSALAPVDSAINGMVTGFLQGTLTMQKAFQNLCTALVTTFMQAIEKMVMEWLASGLMSIFGGLMGGGGGGAEFEIGGALAGVMGFEQGGIVPSAAGGWDVPSAAGGWNVPSASLALLHPQEMVLPANLAQGVRGMVAQGAGAPGAGGVNIQPGAVQIVAFDGADVQRVLLDNPRALAAAINSLGRNFVPV